IGHDQRWDTCAACGRGPAELPGHVHSGHPADRALARQYSVLFWEPVPDEPKPEYPPPSRLRVAGLAILVAASPVLTLLTGTVSSYAHAAAEQLLSRQGYVDAVLGASPDITRSRRPK